ncbi:hypothetical protein IGJ74_000818 [Enterococcus sp. AZ009]
MFSKLTFLLEPIATTLKIISPPITMTLVLYFILKPIVNWLTQLGLSKVVSILLSLFALVSVFIACRAASCLSDYWQFDFCRLFVYRNAVFRYFSGSSWDNGYCSLYRTGCSFFSLCNHCFNDFNYDVSAIVYCVGNSAVVKRGTYRTSSNGKTYGYPSSNYYLCFMGYG